MPYSPMELAETFLKTGELDDALEALNQQIKEQPEDDTARRLRIQVLLRLSKAENLQTALSDIEQLTSPTAEDYQTASIVHERAGNLDAAIQAMKQAINLATTDERLVERLLELQLANENYDLALNLIRQQEQSWRWLEREGDVLVLMGDDTTATARYGLVLAQLDEFEGQMRKGYLEALKARVYLARAHAYRRLEQIDTAREHYLAAKSRLPDDSTIDFNLALLTFLEGDLDTAVQQCKNALECASSHLADSMRNSLKEDTPYQELIEALKENQ